MRERERERDAKWGGWVLQQTFNSYIERSLGEDTIIIEGWEVEWLYRVQ